MTQTTGVSLGQSNCLASLNVQSCKILNNIANLYVAFQTFSIALYLWKFWS